MSIEKLESGRYCVVCDICGVEGDPWDTWEDAIIQTGFHRSLVGITKKTFGGPLIGEWQDVCDECKEAGE